MGCWLSNVIRGIDAAIEDGVDVISISADEQIEHSVKPYYDDLLAIATFNAMKRGIFVSCAAGPSFWKVGNDAPWILTIGASTIDRKIKAIVKLDDNREFEGESAFQPKDLISIPYYDDSDCSMIMPIATHATIFACRSDADLDVGHGSVHLGNAVKNNGGVGMIVCNTPKEGYNTLAQTHVIPAAHVTPTVGYFSSRGPSSRGMSVLKPDIIGPGVSILAPRASSKYGGDDRKALFDMRTGTSVATAHLSGVVALIKSIHPDWSSAVIKSAIMTTSDFLDRDGNRIMDEQRNPASFFALGAGHVNPSKAADPGLVYNITVKDYIAFLCGKGYNNTQVELIAHEKVDCENEKKISDAELNYPAIVCDSRNGKLIVNRTVTNVGETNSKYFLKLDMPKEVQVEVSPKEMVFSEINEKKTYTIIYISGLNLKHCESFFIHRLEYTSKGGSTRNGEGYKTWLAVPSELSHIVLKSLVLHLERSRLILSQPFYSN
ncbi:hypothetical protein LUZ60_001583 [Juncus effusus]|nr:hypothetical protein LUZ60_001583 [Juncus effusus]